jgi:hypothetical protein
MDTGLTLSTTTGVDLRVWRRNDLFHAATIDGEAEPQVCLGVDLFEVIAELGGLDLADADHAGEAEQLAKHAQTELGPPNAA